MKSQKRFSRHSLQRACKIVKALIKKLIQFRTTKLKYCKLANNKSIFLLLCISKILSNLKKIHSRINKINHNLLVLLSKQMQVKIKNMVCNCHTKILGITMIRFFRINLIIWELKMIKSMNIYKKKMRNLKAIKQKIICNN